jgi:hypothetical protein
VCGFGAPCVLTNVVACSNVATCSEVKSRHPPEGQLQADTEPGGPAQRVNVAGDLDSLTAIRQRDSFLREVAPHLGQVHDGGEAEWVIAAVTKLDNRSPSKAYSAAAWRVIPELAREWSPQPWIRARHRCAASTDTSVRQMESGGGRSALDR